MALADNAARAAAAARSAGGTPSAAAKAAQGSAGKQTAFKVVKPKPAPKATKPTTKPAPATKPTTKPAPAAKPNTDPTSQYGLQEDASVSEATNVYNAGVALRTFQEGQARRQLEDALAEIDRAAIANYKGIANDYAARGMARSGGFRGGTGAEEMAMADRKRADTQANVALDDIIYQLGLQGTADIATFNTAKDKILADFLARRFASAQGGR